MNREQAFQSWREMKDSVRPATRETWDAGYDAALTLAADLAEALEALLAPTYAYRNSRDRQSIRNQARAALATYHTATQQEVVP